MQHELVRSHILQFEHQKNEANDFYQLWNTVYIIQRTRKTQYLDITNPIIEKYCNLIENHYLRMAKV